MRGMVRIGSSASLSSLVFRNLRYIHGAEEHADGCSLLYRFIPILARLRVADPHLILLVYVASKEQERSSRIGRWP